jgi:peptidoglycan DL-endopeptidase CwlO
MERRHLTLRTTDSWEYGLDSSGADEQPLAPAKKRRTFAVVATTVCFAAASMTALAANSASLGPDGVPATSSTADTSSSSAAQTPTQAPTVAPATQAPNAPPDAASPATPTPSATPSTPDPSAESPAALAASTAPATPAAAVADSSAALSTTDNTSSTTPSAADASSSTDAIRPMSAVTAPATPPRSPARPHRAIRKPAPIHRSRSTTAYALPALPFLLPVFDVRAWESDHPAAPEGEAAVAIAEHYLGVPYVWGGADPLNGFDCSGLTKFVYAQLGVQLPHYAASQWNMGHRVDPGHLQPGDLVFFEPHFDGPGHVGIYIGNDQFIAAPHTGDVVRTASLSSVADAIGFVGAVRPYDDPAKIEPTHATKTTKPNSAQHLRI